MTWHTTSALADHLGVTPGAIREAFSKGHKVKGHTLERRKEGRRAFFRIVECAEDKSAETGEIIHQRGDYTIVEESGPFVSVPHALKELTQKAEQYRLSAAAARALAESLIEERDELVQELQSCREALELEEKSNRKLLRDLRAIQDELRASQNQGGFKSVVRELRNRAKGLK